MFSVTNVSAEYQEKNKILRLVFRNRSRNRSQNPQPFPIFQRNMYICTNQRMHTMKYVTIIDIAEALNISKSTVSRALRGDNQNVGKETRDKIIAMAEKLGYSRNELAVNLRKQSTCTIGIVVPEMLTPFYMNFITYAQQELNKKGYRVTLAQSHENPKAELANLQMFEDYRVEGILISVCHTEENIDTYKRLIQKGIPMVFFDRTISALPVSRVKIDDYIKAFFLVENLIRNGRKKSFTLQDLRIYRML